jgi:hypothetical protein
MNGHPCEYLRCFHLSWANPHSFPSYSAVQIVYPLIAGIGLGALFLPPLIGMQAAMPVKDMATSSTTFGLFRYVMFLPDHPYLFLWAYSILGSTIGISVGQAIWSGVIRMVCTTKHHVYATSQVLRQRLSKISGLTLNLSGAALADSARQIQSIEVTCLLFHFKTCIQSSKARVRTAASTSRLHKGSLGNMACEHSNHLRVLFCRFGRPLRCSLDHANKFPVLFLKKYSLKRKVIRAGKKGTEVVPASDLEKGSEEKASTEEVQASVE